MTWQPNRYAHGDLAVLIDCADLDRAARFWAAALGYAGAAGGESAAYRSVLPPDGPGVEILLQRTTDGNEFCVLQPPPDYWAETAG